MNDTSTCTGVPSSPGKLQDMISQLMIHVANGTVTVTILLIRGFRRAEAHQGELFVGKRSYVATLNGGSSEFMTRIMEEVS